jgi:hypothetical protein
MNVKIKALEHQFINYLVIRRGGSCLFVDFDRASWPVSTSFSEFQITCWYLHDLLELHKNNEPTRPKMMTTSHSQVTLACLGGRTWILPLNISRIFPLTIHPSVRASWDLVCRLALTWSAQVEILVAGTRDMEAEFVLKAPFAMFWSKWPFDSGLKTPLIPFPNYLKPFSHGLDIRSFFLLFDLII